MAQVAATVFIRAPLDRVYALAKDVEAFPSFMPDVESIRVQQRDGSRPTWRHGSRPPRDSLRRSPPPEQQVAKLRDRG